MWDRSIKLPTGNITVTNDNGFSTDTPTFLTGIKASALDTTRQDQILAQQSGYRADIIVAIMKCNFDQAPKASYFIDESNGKKYYIKRTFHTDKSKMVQLTGEVDERGTV